ncbi:hypothetical protein ACWGE1_33135 [Streptomyces sp. NPDC054932]
MSRIFRTPLRLALLTASTSLVAGGVLLPTGAFAAPAAPHTVTLPAERGDQDQDGSWGGDNEEAASPENPADEAEEPGDPAGSDPADSAPADSEPADSEPADSEPGIVTEESCNDPMALPGLCVDGKPLPKGDDTVVVPQGPQLCLGIDTPEQCADRQKPRVPSPTGSSTVELAI